MSPLLIGISAVVSLLFLASGEQRNGKEREGRCRFPLSALSSGLITGARSSRSGE